MAVRDYKGSAARTTLAAPINNTDLTFSVASGGGTGYPDGTDGNFTVCLDAGLAAEEKVDCESRSGDTFTIAAGGRGYDDTAAAAHSNGANVDHVGTATDLREANAHVNDTTGDPHPQYTTAVELAAAIPSAVPVWIGAGAMGTITGSPSLSGVGGPRYPAWLLDAAVEESVAATWDMPAGWATVHIDLYWTNAGAGSGNVQWDIRCDNVADGGTMSSAGTSAAAAVAAPAQDVLKVTRIHTGLALTSTNLINCRVIRDGANVADTLANDAGVIGVLITKAS